MKIIKLITKDRLATVSSSLIVTFLAVVRAQNNLFKNFMAPYDDDEIRLFKLTYHLQASSAGCPASFSANQPTLIYQVPITS